MGNQVKITGKRGSWFADAGKEYGNLPCVHTKWYKYGTPYPYYSDKGYKLGKKQWDDLVRGIQEKKRVILTKDRWNEDGTFERIDYVAIFAVDNLTLTDSELRFDFIKPLADAK
jgi:hypothetical protein